MIITEKNDKNLKHPNIYKTMNTNSNAVSPPITETII